jgi:hypothetical protein
MIVSHKRNLFEGGLFTLSDAIVGDVRRKSAATAERSHVGEGQASMRAVGGAAAVTNKRPFG